MVEKKIKLSNGKEIIVRDDGKIFNLGHQEYSIQKDKMGYCGIIFNHKRFLIHRIVAEAFLPDYRNERKL